jgi:hypothetical protein
MILAILPVTELTIAQLQRIEQIRSESYIKDVKYGFYSTGECGLTITDTKGRIHTCNIDKDGNYLNPNAHLL